MILRSICLAATVATTGCAFGPLTTCESIAQRAPGRLAQIQKECGEELWQPTPNRPWWVAEWAGEYQTHASMSGKTFALSPSGKFFEQWGGCFDYGTEHGSVVQTLPDSIEISYSGLFSPPNERLVFMRWQGRHYLVRDFDCSHVVNLYNQSQLSSITMMGMLTRNGDDSQSGDPRPQLPQPWASLLRDEPIHAAITQIEGSKTYERTGVVEYTLVLNVGSGDGVCSGATFYMSPSDPDLHVLVRDVKESECHAVYWCKNARDPAVGDKLINRAPGRSSDSTTEPDPGSPLANSGN
jgi:hypothetical protein